jgi:hypothetical protein
MEARIMTKQINELQDFMTNVVKLTMPLKRKSRLKIFGNEGSSDVAQFYFRNVKKAMTGCPYI